MKQGDQHNSGGGNARGATDFAAAFEQSATPMAHIALEGTWLCANRALCELLCYSRDQLLSRVFEDLVDTADRDSVQAQLRSLLRGEHARELIEARLLRSSGLPVWCRVTAARVSLETGAPHFFHFVVEDIEQLKQAELALSDSSARWYRLLDNLSDVLYQFSSKHGGLFFSGQAETLLGVSVEHLLANPMHWIESIHPEDLGRVYRAISGLRSGQSFSIEYRIRDRQGQWHWLRDRSIAHRVSDEELVVDGIATDITEEKDQSRALESARRHLEEIAATIPGALLQYVQHPDGSSSMAYVSQGAERIWGYSPEEIGENAELLWACVHEEDLPGTRDSVTRSAETGSFWEHTWRSRTRDGRLKWLSGTGTPRLLESGSVQWNTVVVDISSEYQSRVALENFFEQALSLHIIVDLKGTILRVNSAWEVALGYESLQLLGKSVADFVHPDDVEQTWREAQRTLAEGVGSTRMENRWRHADGSYRLLSWSSRASSEERLIYAIATDITESRQYEERLRYLAHYDALTGLPNRACFAELLEQQLQRSRSDDTVCALLCLDLDQFKSINDSLGHSTGDAVLCQLSERLRAVIGPADVLARIGGDEFAVLLGGLHAEAEARSGVERILTAFATPVEVEESQLRLSASIGVSLFPRDAGEGRKLMQYADVATYQAKDEGRNSVRFFTPEFDRQVMENAELGAALAMAIERDELALHYQPQLELSSGRVVGLEALLRWQHPVLGPVSPDRFIPIAEQRGMMTEIGSFVLERACVQAAAWRAEGLCFGRVAVNVSGYQMQSERFPLAVEQMLARSGLPAEGLEIELTESVLMRRPESVQEILGRLAELGIQIAIDDFGTGFSSLSYLSKLRVHKLKVDKQFVHDVLEDRNDAALAASIIAMGRALELAVVAEGVETQAQADFLSRNGCRIAQGYLFSRPLPAEELAGFLRAHGAARSQG